MKLYRYEALENPDGMSPKYELVLHEFQVVKETKASYVIELWENGRRKRCAKNSGGKGFAAVSKKCALVRFQNRNRNRIWFLERDLALCEASGKLAQEIILQPGE